MYRLLLIAIMLLACSRSAFAYLDPGVGSFLLQMLLAGLLAVGASLRLFWDRIRDFWNKSIVRRQTPDNESE